MRSYIKYLLIATLIIGIIGLINYASAESQIQSLSPQKQNSNINLPQSCANSTYANITVIYYPNSSYALTPGQYKMTENSNDFYNYTFSNSAGLGNYIVYGHCNENGVHTPWVYDFKITVSGILSDSSNTSAMSRAVYFIFGIGILLFIAFIFIKDSIPMKMTFLVFSIIFFLISVNLILVSLKDEIINTTIQSFFDSFTAISFYAYWFLAGLLALVWAFTFFNTWIYKKNMENIQRFGEA